jgi:GMP synthase-like glutamine amidotransferase
VTTPLSALVVGNRTDPDAGYVGDRLAERGLRLSPVWREDGLPSHVPPDTALVLLLGSEWSVAAPVAPDVLSAECALVRSAAAAGVPVLGLCYGAQVLAHAYGGRVSVAPDPEVGLVDVESVNEALVPAGPWWAFHNDVIDPPPGARLLARNGCGAQAFALPGALGVQFHPEVRPSVLEDWLQRVPTMASAAGVPSADLVALAVRREDEARAVAHALVDAFLAGFPRSSVSETV